MLAEIWDAVPKVQSTFTLVAFLVAACFSGYVYFLKQRTKIITEAAPERQRELINALNESFHINTDGMSQTQKFKLAIETLRERRARLTTWLIFSVVVLLVLVGWTTYSTVQNLVSFEGKLSALVASIKDEPNAPAVTISSDIADFWVSSTTASSSRALVLRICETNSCLTCEQDGATIRVSADGPLKSYQDKNGVELKSCQ
ncbi:hypothetical protein [Mesorhizobium sp. B2-3-5]|uniref:hypothetical protein n=1 Tax=Mesorhizobium sp. B2-3-5 TaxID=2589958 RepID=UPI001126C48D|nr:hypothetical protein [Mesorhizobium sp. B2-3-5]TPM32952.1 hypothetical protein FJ958_09365 [Mesorhizobium sp. B2-3-5]